MNIESIVYPCNDDHFGKDGATDAEKAWYRTYLTKFLQASFPGADIQIDASDTARLVVTPNEREAVEEVREAAEYAWSVCKWEGV